jgi:hypothetical protein
MTSIKDSVIIKPRKKTLAGGHAFVKARNRYFDSEVPQGVKNWMDLPCFSENDVSEKDAEIMPVDKFIIYWRDSGRAGWDENLINNLIEMKT